MPANVNAKVACVLACLAARLAAQELQPRAYIPAPVGFSFFGIAYSNNAGGLLFDPSLPVEDAHVNANIASLMFAQSMGVLGRTAQALVVLPYVEANLDGLFTGAQTHLYRSGLADTSFRYAMNIHGAPAMHLKEYAGYRQKTVIGSSITVNAPTGQYDRNRIVNVGTNRWAFKPELGVSRALGKWALEGAAGVWLYTANHQFNGSSVRTQVPLGSLQAHVVRNLPHRSWVSLDWTFYTGGRSSVDGQDNANYVGNTRLGATYNISLRPRHSVKINFFDGFQTRIGNDTRGVGIAYNVVWQRGI